MTQVVFFVGAHRAVGQEDEGALRGEPPHGVIRVDPGVHPFAGRELGPGRPKFGAEHGPAGTQGGQEIGN